jgi:hypothetical protein
MSPDEISDLSAARESLCRHRSELAKQIGTASRPSIGAAEKLTKVLQAIEAIDRTMNETGQPYMSASVRDPDWPPASSAKTPKPRSKGKA